ncbi:UNVERIFIED_CONTAM: hypothetical protein Scaly_2211600 [Sesamum calycinum]|uniref:Reverse transcriptase domain-containing protein n=1 Tax=Sesamum calycinum TaxID=2727403 RepID=A0AAW2MSP1_9LAMI
MKKVMNLIVSMAQNAFVPGHKICDNIMLAQELFSSYNQKHLSPRCALKVDLRKAYDSVEWDFLFASLRKFRLPERFVCWIEECVTTASFSICLNGEPHGFFFGSRGLRQGDPMSPYLFVLYMEVFHVQMHKNITESSVFRFHWRCRELELFSLCFADDLLLFCRADVASVLVFKEGLDWFSRVSGLQAKPDKSQLILSKSAEYLRLYSHQVLGFQEGVLPLKYLGLPLVHSRLTIQDCQPLLVKVEKHIAGWTGIPLSFAGRGTSDHRYAKVTWSQVCLPYDEGGQGVRAITPVQWIWQYRIRSKSIWTVSLTSGSWSWWKMIKLRHLLLNDIWYEVGTMNLFTDWHDPWHPRGVLIHKFLRGSSVIGVLLDKWLDVVMHDEQWHWLHITNLEMLDITDNLPPIHSPKGPKVGWSSLFLGHFYIPWNLFILWLAILERLSTLDKPWCRIDNQDCSLCDTGEMETHIHLFFDCAYAQHCLSIIRREIQMQWPYTSWKRGIHWASKRWRGRHLVNTAYHAALASLVYHLWRECNLRRFQNSHMEADVVAELVLEQIRSRILSDELKFNLQTSILYRLSRIPWGLKYRV